jgi:protein-L-isoaspartate(D-aspartate) O-methyltransferase
MSRIEGGSQAPACVIAVLRFGEPCIKDGAFSFHPAATSALYWGLPMSGFLTARQKMVDGQVRPSDVTDIRIIDAMLAVPREAFVPQNQRALAYLDLDLDVSEGGPAKRFLIKPVVTAKMLQAAEIKDTDNVLVVGCASGYSAAVVAKLAGRVTATESDPSLAAQATEAFAKLGLGNVTVQVAAAAEGDSADAPYDVIVLNGATEIAPEGLYRQLKDGGRLLGVFAMSQPQRATIVTHSHHDFGNRALFDASVPVLPGLERPPAFVF